MNISELLGKMAECKASDLHLKVGRPPSWRINGHLSVTDFPALTSQDTLSIAQQIVPERLREKFDALAEIDFAFSIRDIGRFRVNVFRQRGFVGMSLRRVVDVIPSMAELYLPDVIGNLADEPRGLVLVTGTTGSGKTTTLAAMIDHINANRSCHIVTIEDPIEVIHLDNKSLINQREIGIDTESYGEALRNVVRQDPDVVLIGEMRDLVTVQAALTAAEMGTLVLSTLHTIDAAETIHRIIDFFPPHQHEQIRLMLASTLRGIVSQRLLPKVGGGLVPAVEVLVATATISELIAENKISGLKEVIEQGDYYGMQSFEQSLIQLYKDKQVTLEKAIAMAHNAHDFQLKLRKLGIDDRPASSPEDEVESNVEMIADVNF